jgi:hypothetical protein
MTRETMATHRGHTTWNYGEQTYTVGEHLNHYTVGYRSVLPGNVCRGENKRLLVFFRKRLYWLGHSSDGVKCCLHDIYTGSMYWTFREYVFVVLNITSQ